MGAVSLVDGPVPVSLLVVGLLAVVVLVVRRAFIAPLVALLVGEVVFLSVDWLVTRVLRLSPEPLPATVRMWLGLGAAVVVLVVGSFFCTGRRRKVVAGIAGVLALVMVASRVNVYFEEYPDVAALLGDSDSGNGSRVDTVEIPGTASGFTGRPARVYLPPGYGQGRRLPVLVLVSGQPGGPDDWVVSARFQQLLDGFAATHGGRAPVTVAVDANGDTYANTMCMDSDIAKADTYLSRDVPDWIKANLRVDPDPARWVFGGWSFGGTCSIQMATRHPDVYPSFVDMAGEREPAISAERAETIRLAFHGDSAAFTALTPLTLMAQRRYPDVWGYFSAGGDETEVQGWMNELSAAAHNAGMSVRTQVVEGQGHSWGVPTRSLVPALEWLAPRLGL